MSGLHLDTNAYVAFKRGDDATLAALQLSETVQVSAVVIGELLAGFKVGARERENRAGLHDLLAMPGVTVHPITSMTAEYYASILDSLRKRGRPIPTNDLWIAAAAMEDGAPLLTFDRHFEAVDGLLLAHGVEDLPA